MPCIVFYAEFEQYDRFAFTAWCNISIFVALILERIDLAMISVLFLLFLEP